jgi:hypothetical protein
MPTYFDKDNLARVRDVLNVLVEAPYFYRQDDPELFGFLRKHKAEVTRFFQELYGWDLHVDATAARLYKPRWHNRALRPTQHDVFDLTRRDDCLAFLLVLEHHEHLLERDNVGADEAALPRFTFGELFAYARDRLREVVGDGAPDDDAVRRLLHGLMPHLLRYRFLRELAADGEDRDRVADDPDLRIYESLPALHLYDVRAIAPHALARALAADPAAEAAP